MELNDLQKWSYAAGETDVRAETLKAAAKLLTLRRDAIRVIDGQGSRAASREPGPNTLKSLQCPINPISILLRGENPMTDHVQVEPLMEWASTIDLSSLQSEDDVETKIVLPLFKLLGYPETHRRGKYPINDYQPGKRGRKSETDHIYFSTANPAKQNADTALLLIEAKKTSEHDLEGAIQQARRYGDLLKTLFLVITNGIQIKVLKRLRYQDDEIIFDITVDQLRDKTLATEVYNQLQFETVTRLKEQASDPLRHSQYVELMRTLDLYPDVQAQLAKGDFELSTKREGRHLTVVKPKVAITCELPIAFEEGSCRIEFSNIMLRELTCRLSHEEDAITKVV